MPGAAPGRGGRRRAVSRFTAKSRRALLSYVNKIDQQAVPAWHFRLVTLTYPRAYPTARASKRHLDTLLKRYEREWGPRPLLWKLEPQRRGSPHYHLLTMHGMAEAPELAREVEWWAAAWHEIAGHVDPADPAQGRDPHHLSVHRGHARGSKPCCEVVREWAAVGLYAGKYLGKLIEAGDGEWRHPGRYWGVRRAELLPIALVVEDVPAAVASKVRRACVAWYERQPSGWFYLPGKRLRGLTARPDGRPVDLPGRRWHGSILMPRMNDDDEPQTLARSWQAWAEEIERPIRPQRRRWPTSRGGCTMFMPVDQFRRIVEWAKREVGPLATADPWDRTGIMS